MKIQNLESILSEISKNKLSEDDKIKIQEILEKYNTEEGITPNIEEFIEPNIETEDFEHSFDFDFFNPEEQLNPKEIIEEFAMPAEKIIPEIDQDGQYQLPLEKSLQMELDLTPLTMEVKPLAIEVNQSSKKSNFQNERIEPIFTIDNIPDTNSFDTSLYVNNGSHLAFKPNKFKIFEDMARSTIGKFHNIFNFKDENGKIDWHNQSTKTVLILKNIKNSVLDNIIVNSISSFISEKYKNSKVGIQTNKIADNLVINLMSREDRYNKDFKNIISLLGYDVKELINPNNTPMLTLQDVSNNVNKIIKENLDLDLTDNGYSSKFISTLSDDNKVKFIKKIVWPKLIEMIGESIKLFEALKEIKSKNPICKEISEIAKKNNIEEDLFVTLLLKNPEGLKKQGIAGFDNLLEKKIEIEKIYFKNEELSGKNFIVIQNLIKASSSLQKLIANTNLPTEQKTEVLVNMQKTIVKSDNKKKVLFETVQESVSASLQDNDFVKSLREVNESILKMRIKQTKETEDKPKI